VKVIDTKETPKVWATEAAKVALASNEGDSLELLRRVFQQYLYKSNVLYMKAAGSGDETEMAKKARIRKTADYYKHQAEIIQALINQ
jgi:hypothetical protein